MPLDDVPGDARSHPRARRTALVAGVALLALYALSAATDVTFWDAGEFLAAFHTLGIPHPPGTPLFVLLGRVAVLVLAPLGPVLSASLLSALCAAASGAIAALLLARWMRSGWAAVAAALCAGATSTIWLDATEAEVYSASLLLVALALLAADRMGRAAGGRRHAYLIAYLFGLAVPLHLSALVGAPAIALLAASDESGHVDWRCALELFGAAVLAAGTGRVSLALCVAGVVCLAASSPPVRRRALAALGMTAAVALGVSGAVVLLLRARHAPALDQGHAVTWSALADVIARRQYAVPGLWPRTAPWWIQVANVFEWADWQFALGVDGRAGPSPWRTPLTLAYAALGVLGARDLRRASVRGFNATLVLLVAGSLGVVAYLNLRAGPSFGWGVLPDDATHEARERDYFFALAFWTWGLWAGLGAMAVARRAMARVRQAPPGAPRAVGLVLAALPIATNWRAVARRRSPDAELPRALASGILASAPANAVLLLVGDNDTYPIWYLQLGERRRPDVTPVTVPLLGAPWYRGELARRHRLLHADAPARWSGTASVLREIADAAARERRPLAAAVGVSDADRTRIGGTWTLTGLVWVRTAATGDGRVVDSVATARIAARIDTTLFAPVRPGSDGAGEWAQALLGCPRRALVRSLDATCNLK
ncbi:Protein of unknown function DUF2723 [Gemmatirosa kalamazoonensis]|uniref:DUF2723 domain-containing protein n=1 Tax=Gemmatirosa kalamazoonensis TaxID=861299 RepID=W0RMB3_9BACT|nr:DUF2723 domain-containing protein [Gemmatirosa kalamazoonensis]AHG90583.1 Protein of unknown function DUF2723 [Gemmatirosa kalamazoonensis]